MPDMARLGGRMMRGVYCSLAPLWFLAFSVLKTRYLTKSHAYFRVMVEEINWVIPRRGYGLGPLGVSGVVGSSAGFSAFLLAATLRHIKIPMEDYDRRKEAHMSKLLKKALQAKSLVCSIMNLVIRSAEAGAATAALLAQAHNHAT